MALIMTRPASRRIGPTPDRSRWLEPTRRTALWLFGWPVRYVRARRNLAVLAAMSDMQLKDIGLYRADVVSATALPRDEDPTPQLAALVRERRQYRGARRG
ncbi:hypothetical protein GCM10007036_47410 [Alsobacter metallidurans]|uniref:YjiS-like domain-containing protein n=1 Tax=Alsobacter metallidurans TaxID=340221 RepID=A0A917MMC2_9HYPH|nr:DUF1127 domain-containing protein [Alsobacter metallidurans]GGH34194.1 hypothetical protein GCM10007036_47410 [Alsobacter metallidurans]